MTNQTDREKVARMYARARKRQIALTKQIGIDYCQTDMLIPLSRHGSFKPPLIPIQLGVFGDQRLCDIAWWVVGDLVGEIDHAWTFGWGTEDGEAWGFVTEPYVDEAGAREIARLASKAMPCHTWGVHFYALDPRQGSWNPPHCVPIVALSRDFSLFIRKAVPIALDIKTVVEAYGADE